MIIEKPNSHMNTSIKKVISSALFAGILIMQFPAGFALAFYNDIEISFNNNLDAGIVDIMPESAADFSPMVSPSSSAVRYITLSDVSSTVPFQYKVVAENFNGTLCQNLNVVASLNGTPMYTGLLSNFVAQAPYEEPADWTFTANLNSSDAALQAQVCQFDIVYKAWQLGFPEYRGFRDIERVPSIIRADIWNGNKPNKCAQYNGEPGHLSVLVSIGFMQPNCREESIVYDVNCQSGEQIDCSSINVRYANSAPTNYFHQITPSTSQYTTMFGSADENFAGMSGVVWYRQPATSSSKFSLVLMHPTMNYLYAYGGDILFEDCDGAAQKLRLNFEYIDDCESWSGVTTMPQKAKVIPPNTVVLNELLPNPAGYDVTTFGLSGEWVEIYNNSPTSSYNLNGFYLRNQMGFPYMISNASTMSSSTVIGPNGYLVVYVPGGFMSNWGDTVTLHNRDWSIIDSHSFGTPTCDNTGVIPPTNDDEPYGNCTSTWALADKSIARYPDGAATWVDPRPTPGAPNQLTLAELEILAAQNPATTTPEVISTTTPAQDTTTTTTTTIPFVQIATTSNATASTSDTLTQSSSGGGGSPSIIPPVETIIGGLNDMLLINPPAAATSVAPTGTIIVDDGLIVNPQPEITPSTTVIILDSSSTLPSLPVLPITPIVPAAQDVQTPPAQEPNTELVAPSETNLPDPNPSPSTPTPDEPVITPVVETTPILTVAQTVSVEVSASGQTVTDIK